MFNLFKKTETTQVAPQVISQEEPMINNGYPQIVHEVHREFLTAGDKLLEEAKQILQNGAEKAIDKGTRLAKLGFKSCPEVAHVSKLVETKELAELIEHYRISYPNNKFITEGQVREICLKYKLIRGDVSLYTGFVPEAKLSQIENFKLRDKEKNCIIANNGMVFEDAEISRCSLSYYHICKKGKVSYDKSAFQSDDGITFYSEDRNNIFGYRSQGNTRFSIVSRSFEICAPEKDMQFNTSTHKVGQDYRIEQIPDPIVMQAVKGGFLIIAAWGNEASDEIVVDETKN